MVVLKIQCSLFPQKHKIEGSLTLMSNFKSKNIKKSASFCGQSKLQVTVIGRFLPPRPDPRFVFILRL